MPVLKVDGRGHRGHNRKLIGKSICQPQRSLPLALAGAASVFIVAVALVSSGALFGDGGTASGSCIESHSYSSTFRGTSNVRALDRSYAAEACVVIPTVAPERITPHTEGLCAVVWHLLVSHPALKRAPTKWESTK